MTTPMISGLNGWRDEMRRGPSTHPTPPVKDATTAQTGSNDAIRYEARRRTGAAGIWAMRW